MIEIPYSGISNLSTFSAMFSAWLFVRSRIKKSKTPLIPSIILFRRFFLNFAIFGAFLTLPYLALYVKPDIFPQLIALGGTIGHIFLFAAFIMLMKISLTLIPKLADKQWIAVVIGGTLGIAAVVGLFIFTVFGTQPEYDYDKHLTLYNINPGVAAILAAGAFVADTPLAILFLINGFKSRASERTRSLLLGVGFVLITIAGPLNSIAMDWFTYLAAVILTFSALVLIATGVAYKISAGDNEPQQSFGR